MERYAVESQAESSRRRLKEAGFDRAQAEALLHMISDSHEALATKQDVATAQGALKQDIAAFEGALKQDIAAFEGALKQDIAAFEGALKQDIADVRTELKQDIADVRTDLSDLATTVAKNTAGIDALERAMETLRQEVRDRFESFRQEIAGQMGGLTGELRGEMNGLRGEMNGLRGEMNGLRGEMRSELRALKWMFGTVLAMMVPMVGSIIALALR